MKDKFIQEFAALRQKLAQRKAEIEAELANIDSALKGGPVVTPVAKPAVRRAKAAPAPKKKVRAPRPKNTMSLKQAVVAAVTAGPLSRPDILAAVTAAGYKFAAKSPLGSLNTLLYSDKAFKNVDGKFGLSLEGAVDTLPSTPAS